MSTNRSRMLLFPALIASGFVFVASHRSYSSDSPSHVWKAPERAAKQPNPVAADADAIAAGKKLFVGNCLECHGAAGKGDGPDATTCNPRPANLSGSNISSQADGELFWKITEGKEPMPAYEKLLPDADRWKVVDYIRILCAPPKGRASEGK
jgi:mono/diheme cytochrome c family protein